jgi:hypothetical protein
MPCPYEECEQRRLMARVAPRSCAGRSMLRPYGGNGAIHSAMPMAFA